MINKLGKPYNYYNFLLQKRSQAVDPEGEILVEPRELYYWRIESKSLRRPIVCRTEYCREKSWTTSKFWRSLLSLSQVFRWIMTSEYMWGIYTKQRKKASKGIEVTSSVYTKVKTAAFPTSQTGKLHYS